MLVRGNKYIYLIVIVVAITFFSFTTTHDDYLTGAATISGIAGCHPGTECTATCDDLFASGTGTWSIAGDICLDTGITRAVLDHTTCDISLGAGTGECTDIPYLDVDVYNCPSYIRNGNTSVEAGDCVCDDLGNGCATSAAAIMDLTNEFFAGPASASLPAYNFTFIQPSNITIQNSSIATYNITVSNTGNNTDNYTIAVNNIDDAFLASINVSTLSELSSLDSSNLTLVVADPTVGNYTIFVNLTSTGNTSLSQLIIIQTQITGPDPNVSISLVTPSSNVPFNKDVFTAFTVNVSCTVANCGTINVSLDPISINVVTGCDPDASSCTSVCNDIFVSTSGTWNFDGVVCINDSAPVTSTILPDPICDTTPLGAGTGQCANKVSTDDYYCPSYTRNSDVAVVVGDCVCTDLGGSCSTGADLFMDLTHEFFSGSSGSSSKTGLVNDTIGATPFYVNSSNPVNISLSTGESTTVTWYVNATASGSLSTYYTYYAYANITSDMTLSATSSKINISIFETNTSGLQGCASYDGDSASCISNGCDYDAFIDLCFPNINNFDCNTYCDICTTEFTCTTSTKDCTWETEGFCHENFASFEYGDGGSEGDFGWENVMPPSCIANPTQCDSSFDATYNFVAFEDSCFDNVDNDLDGSTDYNDGDCFYDYGCRDSYNASSDTTAPQVKNIDVDSDNDSANIQFVTSEPTTGEINYYYLNSSCNESQLNLTLITTDIPDLYHFIFIDDYTINTSLQNGTTYFYKINVSDQANRTYQSSCLNFTTQVGKTSYAFNFSGAEDLGLQFDFGDGFVPYSDATGLTANETKDAHMSFGGFGINFAGVDLARAVKFDFSNAFDANTIDGGEFNGRPFTKINSTIWQQMKQQLGVDNVTLVMQGLNCNIVYKCNDNGSTCQDVTSESYCVQHNATHVNVTASSFSSYVSGSNTDLNISDDTDNTEKTPSDTITFTANYSNSSSGVSMNPTDHGCKCNITISEIDVNYTGMSFNSSGDTLWTYTTSDFTTAGTYNWSVNCSADNFDNLNTSDAVVITAAATSSTNTTTTAAGGGGSGGAASACSSAAGYVTINGECVKKTKEEESSEEIILDEVSIEETKDSEETKDQRIETFAEDDTSSESTRSLAGLAFFDNFDKYMRNKRLSLNHWIAAGIGLLFLVTFFIILKVRNNTHNNNNNKKHKKK